MNISLAATELCSKKKKKKEERQRLLKKEVRWLKRTARMGEKEKQTCLSLPSLWYDKFYAQQLCLSIKARGVCWTISQGGRREEEGREEGEKNEARKRRGERAETLSSNSRKWVDPVRGRLCSLCGFNESTVFRTRRGTRELA